jgi:hypothetical protein
MSLTKIRKYEYVCYLVHNIDLMSAQLKNWRYQSGTAEDSIVLDSYSRLLQKTFSCLQIFSSTVQTVWMYLLFHLFGRKICRNTDPSHTHVWDYQTITVIFTSLVSLDCLLKRGILINNRIIIQLSSFNFTFTDIKICMTMFPNVHLLKYFWMLELLAGNNSGHWWRWQWWWNNNNNNNIIISIIRNSLVVVSHV